VKHYSPKLQLLGQSFCGVGVNECVAAARQLQKNYIHSTLQEKWPTKKVADV